MYIVKDFRDLFPGETTKDLEEVFDKKNGIKVYLTGALTQEQILYKYIEYLNNHQYDFKRYKYLNLGMMPLLYVPSFTPDSVVERIKGKIGQLGIKYYLLPFTSFLQRDIFLKGNDIWCFKEDFAPIVGKQEHDVSILDFYDMIFKENDEGAVYEKIEL